VRDHTKLKSTAFWIVSCNGVAIDQVPQKIDEIPVEMMHILWPHEACLLTVKGRWAGSDYLTCLPYVSSEFLLLWYEFPVMFSVMWRRTVWYPQLHGVVSHKILAIFHLSLPLKYFFPLLLLVIKVLYSSKYNIDVLNRIQRFGNSRRSEIVHGDAFISNVSSCHAVLYVSLSLSRGNSA
jgi:hypothetical protein